MKETFRYGLKAYTANTVSFINYRFDMFLILYFLSPVELGYYAVAVMIGEKLWYLSMATGTVLFPRIASSPKPDASLTLKTAALNLYIILLAAILLGIFSHLLIGIFYGDVYVFAAEALIFLLPGIVAMAIPKLLMADLSGRGKPEYAMIASLCSLIVNVLLNIILIPVYGILGAAIASSIAYIVAALVFMYYYKRETSVNLRELFILKIGDITRIKAEI
jgi:O-antigen/teichoic acid export membrane protein